VLYGAAAGAPDTGGYGDEVPFAGRDMLADLARYLVTAVKHRCSQSCIMVIPEPQYADIHTLWKLLSSPSGHHDFLQSKQQLRDGV